ncbi:peptide chain release factor H [Desulfatibacillum aliphaticivorans]|uniref:peptide chain release factor H n=1 Tax=Desulfatibacillum aliphaticivorans TaxID=218208 RepID=UPI000404F63E|nr:peptide chain release factor H [Desulfatibacillum aliphaticivorans]
MKKYATITSGRGPAECQWAAARVRDRFVKEAEERKIPVKIRESIPGDNPGDIRSCLLILDREKARDFLKSWEGTILWIGQSPYRPYHKRKNWYVGVTVGDAPPGRDVSMEDVRVDVMRAKGPGGQHVNKTSSAVRMVHEPTGISAMAGNRRSQARNRREAEKMLERRLSDQQIQAEKQDETARWTNHNQLERGNPVRTFEGRKFRERK